MSLPNHTTADTPKPKMSKEEFDRTLNNWIFMWFIRGCCIGGVTGFALGVVIGKFLRGD